MAVDPDMLAVAFCVAGLGVLAAVLLEWLYSSLFRKPREILSKLRAQGVPGFPFQLYVGQLPAILKTYARRDNDPAYAASTDGSLFWNLATADLGPLWTFAIGRNVCLTIADPEIVRQVYVANSTKFPKQEFVKRSLSILGQGLVLSDGDLWQRQRRLIHPSFSMREIKRLYPVMVHCTQEALDRWEAKLTPTSSKGDVPPSLLMDDELAGLTMDIVFRSVFGAHVGSILSPAETQELLHALAEHFPKGIQREQMAFLLPFYGLLPTELNSALRKTTKVINTLIRKIVQARLAEDKGGQGGGEDNDLLGLLLRATDLVSEEYTSERPEGEKSSTGAEDHGTASASGRTRRAPVLMSEQQLIDESITFFAAGSETTANALTWTMLLLSQHPEWQEKARQEALGLCKGGPWAPSYEDLGELKTMTCILYESLRLYPPVPIITRTCNEDVRLSDSLVVPAGCDIYIPIEAMHKSPKLWGPDAAEFNPSRFANGVSKAPLNPGAFMPFSLGPRSCVGQNFAIAEAKVILGALLCRFSWKAADSYLHHPEVFTTLRAKHGLPMILTPLSP